VFNALGGGTAQIPSLLRPESSPQAERQLNAQKNGPASFTPAEPHLSTMSGSYWYSAVSWNWALYTPLFWFAAIPKVPPT
jgi:hypothetical protein